MDLSKTGKLIAESRKEKGFTQVELAEKIGVSEKTISKWECGKGFPDTSIILDLCKTLGISTTELLSGKRLTKEEYVPQTDKAVVELIKEKTQKDRLLLSLEWVLMAMSVIILLTSALISAYIELDVVYRVLILVGGVLFCSFGIVSSIVIETKAGYYCCPHCNHKYVPTYKQSIFSMHINRTKYLKCPNCHKRGWNKKVIDKD